MYEYKRSGGFREGGIHPKGIFFLSSPSSFSAKKKILKMLEAKFILQPK
jgi:hypothetical protein